MRLIDADRLMTRQMQSMYYHLPNGDIAIPIVDIDHAPTVEVPEIVRCKDCNNKECWGREGNVACGIDGAPHMPDWFCAYGERR